MRSISTRGILFLPIRYWGSLRRRITGPLWNYPLYSWLARHAPPPPLRPIRFGRLMPAPEMGIRTLITTQTVYYKYACNISTYLRVVRNAYDRRKLRARGARTSPTGCIYDRYIFRVGTYIYYRSYISYVLLGDSYICAA